MTQPRPVALIILDGLGLRDEEEGNAVRLARTPTLDRLAATVPTATLKASGEDVGLPAGQIGNSEVGHTNIGAGRVVWMDLPRIDRAIAEGGFASTPALLAHVEALRESGGTSHVMGLLSPGGVHSHQRHVVATARAVAEAGVPVALHLFTDGRDVAPGSMAASLAALRAGLGGVEGVRVATVSGRFYAMDRDNRWDRVQAAHAAIVEARGKLAPSAEAALEAAGARGEGDEFVIPTVVEGHAGMRDGDGVLMVNFRADRARELLDAIAGPGFDAFPRRDLSFAAATGMVGYSASHDAWMDVLFPDQDIPDTLGEVVARAGMTQFRLAETEKYPHVTFFLNGGAEAPLSGETRHMEPSPKVRTYDEAPEMSARGVTDALVAAIRSGAHDLIVVNYANPDMVGHTGDLDAAIRAVEVVDGCLGEALDALSEAGGAALVTADHGNCETMIDPATGRPHTAHTLNEVPVHLVGMPGKSIDSGRLADVAPTLLAMLGLEQPAAMTGASLLREPSA